jgi:predicted phosphoribosyltransferase
MPFQNRTDAGRQLAQAVSRQTAGPCTVLALPRGGVIVGAEVASALGAPLDVVLVRKIGVPFQPELAMGAIVDGEAPLIVRNEEVIRLTGVDEAQFAAVSRAELQEIERRRASYVGDRPPVDVTGRTAIVVDDGIATGATTRAALRAVRRRNPAALVLAVPVAPTSTISELRSEADQVVCLEAHDDFAALGFYYADFRQVSDAEVVAALARCASVP